MSRILIIGSGGQLGSELQVTLPTDLSAVTTFLTRDQLDITSDRCTDRIIDLHPELVINASAYTQVDKAESDRTTAFAVNYEGPERLASSCSAIGARLIHISTDFIFDGEKSSPYTTADTPHPLSTYGESKYRGEQAIRNTPGLTSIILRTSWVYSASGQNFVKTMLRLFGEKDSLNVVYDQVGSPTWARNLAHVIWQLATRPGTSGTFHFTDAGVTSWYDFALAIQEEGRCLGMVEGECPIYPILSAAYPTPARRPHFSVLDNSALETELGIKRTHWRTALRRMLEELQ